MTGHATSADDNLLSAPPPLNEMGVRTDRRPRLTSSHSLMVFSLDLTRSSAIAEGPRDASCQLKSCQLPRNSAETPRNYLYDKS